VRGVTAAGAVPGVQRLYFRGRLVFTHWETGPIFAPSISPDAKWLVFFVDEYGGQSSIADGTPFYVISTHGGHVHDLGKVLPYPDSLTWCGGELVVTPGTDRVAIDGKRLLVAAPPGFGARPLWNDPARTFGTPSCQPHRAAVAVLTQHTSTNANFFAPRWRLWRVGLDGTRRLLDIPPAGWADEQPTWSPDGRSLAFVRERNGYGRVMIRTNGRLYGPVAQLGYALGYYGHHDWGLVWRA
jgi:Tol biopolymer transport system component